MQQSLRITALNNTCLVNIWQVNEKISAVVLVSQEVHSGFSITAYRKTWANFLAHPILIFSSTHISKYLQGSLSHSFLLLLPMCTLYWYFKLFQVPTHWMTFLARVSRSLEGIVSYVWPLGFLTSQFNSDLMYKYVILNLSKCLRIK